MISVLILAYNHGRFIERCLRSVFAQLPNHPAIEVIIIDDGSPDDTAERVERLRADAPIPIEYIRRPHEGIHAIARNFNELVTRARGDYITFLSADDEFVPDRFREQIALLDATTPIVYGNGLNVVEGQVGESVIDPRTLRVLETRDAGALHAHVTRAVPLLFIQGVLAERRFLQSVIPFDEELIADDWVFNIRVSAALAERGLRFGFVDRPMFLRHKHAANTSADPRAHIPRVTQVVEKYCDPAARRAMLLDFYAHYTKRLARRGDPYAVRTAWSYLKQRLRTDAH